MVGIKNAEFAEGDQTCQRRDQGTRSAYVDAQQKRGVIGSKFGEQNGGGNVADELTA